MWLCDHCHAPAILYPWEKDPKYPLVTDRREILCSRVIWNKNKGEENVHHLERKTNAYKISNRYQGKGLFGRPDPDRWADNIKMNLNVSFNNIKQINLVGDSTFWGIYPPFSCLKLLKLGRGVVIQKVANGKWRKQEWPWKRKSQKKFFMKYEWKMAMMKCKPCPFINSSFIPSVCEWEAFTTCSGINHPSMFIILA